MQKYNSERLTKRSSITKSAEIGLIPYGKTEDTIKKLRIIEVDQHWADEVKQRQPIIDTYLMERISVLLADFIKSIRDKGDFALSKEFKEAKEDEIPARIKEIAERLQKECESFITASFTDKIRSAEWLFSDKPGSLGEWLKSKDKYAELETMQAISGTRALFDTFCNNRLTLIGKFVPKRVAENFIRYAENVPVFAHAIKNNDNFIVENEDILTVYSSYDGYFECITPAGINAYNGFISGKNDENGIISLGYNGYANEYNQSLKKNNSKKSVLFKANRLYKQALFPEEKAFEIAMIGSDKEFIDVLGKVIDLMPGLCSDTIELFDFITPETIVDEKKLHMLSFYLFNNHETIPQIIEDSGNKRKKEYTLTELADMGVLTFSAIKDVLKKLSVAKYRDALRIRDDLVRTGFDKVTNIRERQDIIDLIVKYTEAVKEVGDILSPFITKSRDASLFNVNAAELKNMFRDNSDATNLMRNYITKSLKKQAKLTRMLFNQPGKLDAAWWNGRASATDMVGKFSATQNGIIRMDGKYYLFMLTNGTKPVKFEISDDNVDALEYKKLAGASKLLPKTVFSKGCKAFFENKKGSVYEITDKMDVPVEVTEEMYRIYKDGSFKKDYLKTHPGAEDTVRNNLTKIIELYKTVMMHYSEFDSFDLSGLKDAKDYATLKDFADEIDTLTTSMRWVSVSRAQILDMVERHEALMFLIDGGNMYKEGKKKTMPAKVLLEILSDENMAHVSITLNSKPAIYYREPLGEGKVTHKVGSALVNKIDCDGNYVPDDVYMQLYGYHNGKISKAKLTEESLDWLERVGYKKCDRDLIKDNRYYKPHFHMTYSYTINKDVERDSSRDITKDIEELTDGNIVSVVRGIRDLLYYVVADKNGKTLESGSLNVVGGINYYEKLKMLGFSRNVNKSRHWIYDTRVEDIKDAYRLAAAGEVVKIAVKYNAIIVLEDINKASREKWACIDHQIFGKFVDAVVNKASSYQIPAVTGDAPGSIKRPLQLSFVPTNGFKMRKKGIVNTVSSGTIISVDPESGFIPAFDYRDINSMKKQKEFFKKFSRIEIKDSCIEFEFDYSNFKTSGRFSKSKWAVMAYGERAIYNVEKKKMEIYPDIVKFMLDTFKENGDKIGSDNLLGELDSLSRKSIDLLFRIFRITVDGYVRGNGKDYYVSPVTGKRIDDYMAERAKLLIKKYRFTEEFFEREGRGKYTELWIEELQKSA